MKLNTCVGKDGRFRWGIHRPNYDVTNLREKDHVGSLGLLDDGSEYRNHANFPANDVSEPDADWIYEIPNAFPFRGATFICKSWADAKAKDPSTIGLPKPRKTSFQTTVDRWNEQGSTQLSLKDTIATLPDSLRIALASSSTDPADLVCLAEYCCDFVYDETSSLPIGLKFRKTDQGAVNACISDHALFDTLVNNKYLPDEFKEVMVLRPGVQGRSEIVGDCNEKTTHIFEYLRRNSYIPWGHYAANMANDAIRYAIGDLSLNDIHGLRHLYYQRTYVRLAAQLGLKVPDCRRALSDQDLEALRQLIADSLKKKEVAEKIEFDRTLWGWNFGFDYAPSHYRLHASHQQVHQQFALIPRRVPVQSVPDQTAEEFISGYGCGNLVSDFIESYNQQTGKSFFQCYLESIRNNVRTDGRQNPNSSLIVIEDENVVVFVPKAQTSQWELQLMTLKPVGNILEVDRLTRQSLDKAMLLSMKVLEGLGAKMITSIEFPKPFDSHDEDHRLLYSFLPRLPESPGAFSEAQLRWINGHYPEDFAAACRMKLEAVEV